MVDFDSLPPPAQAVELACRCDDVSDDAVELRLLKALLTCVTSTALAVHGQALLLVVRACYNIFLTSRSDVNQATAKATLTQARRAGGGQGLRGLLLLLLLHGQPALGGGSCGGASPAARRCRSPTQPTCLPAPPPPRC